MKLAVAIDASPLSVAAMDEAVSLTRAVGGSLKAVYVQDDLLLRLADSPLVRVVSPFADAKLTRREVVEAQEIQLKIIRDTFTFITAKKHVDASLELRNGNIEKEILSAAKGFDLTVMPWGGWQVRGFYYSTHMILGRSRFAFPPLGSPIGMADKTEFVLDKSRGPVLALKNDIAGRPFGVYYDGSEEAKKTLKWALANVPALLGYASHPFDASGREFIRIVMPAGKKTAKPNVEHAGFVETADLVNEEVPLLIISRKLGQKIDGWGWADFYGSVLVV